MVETSADNGTFAEEISKLGCEWAQIGKRKLKMVLPEGIGIRDLYRIAAEGEIQIRRLDYRRDSLQDIFLRAMETDRGGL